MLLNNYSRILVLLNNYFKFFEFWSNLVCHVCRRPTSRCRSTSGDWRRDGERRRREALVALANNRSATSFWLTIDPSLDVRGRVVLGLVAGTGHARIQLLPADRSIICWIQRPALHADSDCLMATTVYLIKACLQYRKVLYLIKDSY